MATSKTRVYKVNLRGFDLSRYDGIVTYNFIDQPGALIGRAEILRGKTKVRVTFLGLDCMWAPYVQHVGSHGVPEEPDWLSVGYLQDTRSGRRQVVELSVISGKEPSAYMKRKIRKQLDVSTWGDTTS